MPGVFGLAGKGLDIQADELFERMARCLRRQPWYQETRHFDEQAGVALGRMALDFAPDAAELGSNDDGSLLAVMDGEIYDYDGQRRALAANGHNFRTANPAELLVHGYEGLGPGFFRNLHGKFIAAIWDGKRRRLILANDRFGMRPLFYAHGPGRLIFASEIKAILADADVPRGHNLRGMAQFFTYGQLLGEDTLLEAIRSLPAAGWLTYDPDDDRLTVDRYWRLEADKAGQSWTGAQHLDRIDQAFETAVQRCSGGSPRLGLSLSGGLDARTILGVMDDGAPLQTVCIGIEGSMDHRSAAEMARLTNRPHQQCLLGDGFLGQFEEHLRHMVHLTDGHYLSQCIVMPTLPVYRDLGIQVLLRGHAGELMHMRKAYSFSLDEEALGLRDEAGLENWLLGHLQTYMLQGIGGRLFAPAYRDAIEELARDSLRACLRESAGLAPLPQRIWHLFLTQRSRRETAMSLVKFGSLVETRLPYLDNELVDAVFAAPLELKLDETIQAHILARRRPSLLNVVNVNTGARVGAGRLGKFIAKARQKIFAKLGVRGYQPYEKLGLWLRRELRPLVQSLLLTDRCLQRGLFDPTTLRRVVHNHFNGSNHTFLILALMIYEMGQREFLEAGARPVCLPFPINTGKGQGGRESFFATDATEYR